MELNREQIIKALECCASEEYICTQCPIDEKIKDDCECGKVVARNALALIKELTEENERLNDKCANQREEIRRLQNRIHNLTQSRDNHREKAERVGKQLRAVLEQNKKIGIENFNLICELSRIKAATARKMQERITAFFENDETVKYVEVDAEYINEQIDKIAKEMEENLK